MSVALARIKRLFYTLKPNSAITEDSNVQHIAWAHTTVTPNSKCDYVVRKATEDDNESIKALSRLTHKDQYKTDYLCGNLRRYLADKNRTIYVAERKGDKKLIGLSMLLLGIDDGLTVHPEAGRTDPEYRGQGVIKDISRIMMADVQIKCPNWKFVHATSTNTDFYDTLTDRVDILAKRFILRMRLTPSDIQRFLGTFRPTMANIKQMTSMDLRKLLSDPDFCQYFYPEGCMVLEHTVFMPLVSNMTYVTDYHSDMLISGDVTSRDAGLSIGGAMSVNDGKTWRYNFNYTGASNIDTCSQHLRHQLYCNIGDLLTRNETYLILVVPDEFGTTYGRDNFVAFWKDLFQLNTNVSSLKQYTFRYKSNSI